VNPRHSPRARRRASLVALALLAGCAGNGTGLDATGRPAMPGGPADTPLTADFASIQTHVFTPVCSVCHAGAAAPQGLRLDASSSYALLVGVPSVEVSRALRVRAGDPDASYLIQKLEGHAAVGAQMPLGGPPLPSTTIAVIRAWIAVGAPPPGGTAAVGQLAATRPQLEVASPEPASTASPAPPRLVLGFDRTLDATRVDAFTLRLERFADDGTWSPVDVAVAIADGNAATALVTPAETLAPGTYRLTTGGPGLSIAGLEAAPDAPVTVLSSFNVEASP
jgi:hypothetical protein